MGFAGPVLGRFKSPRFQGAATAWRGILSGGQVMGCPQSRSLLGRVGEEKELLNRPGRGVDVS
jgi:hypothetical protein